MCQNDTILATQSDVLCLLLWSRRRWLKADLFDSTEPGSNDTTKWSLLFKVTLDILKCHNTMLKHQTKIKFPHILRIKKKPTTAFLNALSDTLQAPICILPSAILL